MKKEPPCRHGGSVIYKYTYRSRAFDANTSVGN